MESDLKGAEEVENKYKFEPHTHNNNIKNWKETNHDN